ncbi:MAG: FdhF/YdeP family oxidoreductase [Polyangia bacterium]
MQRSAAATGAQPPDDSERVKVGAPSETAGGAAAILSALAQVRAHTGLVRGSRALLTVNQSSGFDCPGCAWPDPSGHRSDFEFCENGAKAVAWEITDRTIDGGFFAARTVDELLALSDFELGQAGRFTEPLILRPGSRRYEPIAWDAAFALIAEELAALAAPGEAAFYTSGRTSNEAAFLYQLFVRQLGTNNLPDCSNLCHESSGVALKETIGVGKGTVQLVDFEQADAIFILGQNPGTNHPRMLTTLQKAAERGCKIVSINPLPEAALQRFAHPQEPLELLGKGTAISTLFLPVRIDGDAALLKAIMKELLAHERRQPGTVFDWPFIREHTEGIEALIADLDAEDLDELCAVAGVSREQVRAAVDIARSARRIICCWAMGLTQHKAAVATIQQVVNFLLLGGHMGRPGAGACPVRGHSNVQGDRTMGISPRVDEAFLSRLGARYGFSAPPEPGLDTVGTIEAMRAGRIKVFCALGGNFLQATPDTERTAEALGRCRLLVHISTKLHRGHLVVGPGPGSPDGGHGQQSLILPCLGRTEIDVQASGPQLVTVENSMGVVHASRGNLRPVSPQLKSEVAIVCELAQATLARRAERGTGPVSLVPWLELRDDYDRIREHIESVIPGFVRYNERVRAADGFLLPNAVRQRDFHTATGKARFTVHAVPRHTLGPGQLLMMTLRTHDQFNTTVYGLDDRYRGIRGGRRVILLNEEDLRELGLVAQQRVDITSHFQGATRTATRFVAVPYPIPRRCAATYFPESNVLVPLESHADKSRTPTSKSVVITLAPSA